ncbi:MAG: hypothetical protein F6K63_11625 [Moorea sp. SIO1G6]|uniref:hypothetical protein n=1 Tax=Moorena sp. SIO1G6 TaxID=2607840 RepID=UPI0013BF3B81|nr:hypothetical protein [Moorena sp. SIO1G6]NET64996.1 hypothetical protein [Moorena sp. SIO1G6]
MSDCRGLPHEQLPWFPRGLQRCSAVLGVSPMSDCIKTGAEASSAHRPKTMSNCIKRCDPWRI